MSTTSSSTVSSLDFAPRNVLKAVEVLTHHISPTASPPCISVDFIDDFRSISPEVNTPVNPCPKSPVSLRDPAEGARDLSKHDRREMTSPPSAQPPHQFPPISAIHSPHLSISSPSIVAAAAVPVHKYPGVSETHSPNISHPVQSPEVAYSINQIKPLPSFLSFLIYSPIVSHLLPPSPFPLLNSSPTLASTPNGPRLQIPTPVTSYLSLLSSFSKSCILWDPGPPLHSSLQSSPPQLRNSSPQLTVILLNISAPQKTAPSFI